MVENDRIIGGIDDVSTQLCADFLRATFVSGGIHETNARTAETAKLVENAYRDVNIAFANELSMLAAELDLDVWRVIDLANCHPRVQLFCHQVRALGAIVSPSTPVVFKVHACPEATPLIRTASCSQ